MRPGSELIGIGIDLISWSRVERFLAQHSFKLLKRLLTPAEQEAFQKARPPLQFFARCFTAKEAYFKARGANGMGEAGFNQIEILMEGSDRFRAEERSRESRRPTKGQPEPKKVSRVSMSRTPAFGYFFESPDGIGAQIFIWREKSRT